MTVIASPVATGERKHAGPHAMVTGERTFPGIHTSPRCPWRGPITTIVTHGFSAEPRSFGPTPPVALPGEAPASRLAWLARGGVEAGAYAIAIHSDRMPDAQLRVLEMLRTTVFSSRLGIYATSLSPLASRVLGGLVAAIAPHVPESGRLFAVLPRLESELAVFAWVDSVARLTSPSPTKAQTAASLLPGVSFGVSISPRREVVRLSSERRFPEPPDLEGDWEVVVAGRTANPSWIAESVEPAFGGVDVRDEEEPEGDPSGWWGTRQAVEVVAYPTDAGALAERLSRGLRASPCRWCGEPVAGKLCPFCRQRRMRRRHPTTAVAA